MPSDKVAHHTNSRIRPKLVYVPVAPRELPPDDRIKWALEQIQSDVAKNGGTYPFSSRKPGIQEVLRRAGLGKTSLEKKGDDAERDARRARRKGMIIAGLQAITGRVVSTSTAPVALREDADDVAAVRQAWHLVELELDEALHRIKVLETELAAALARSF
ncbi:hypothetical protein ACC689_20770 [Rhizobium ruizarguesonis]